MNGFSAYSLTDVRTVLYHPDVGQCVLSDTGSGKITISRTGDLASHTTTADGYVVINRMRAPNGTVTLEIPQNSAADRFLRKWIRYITGTQTSGFARSTLTVYDTAGSVLYTMQGVTPQKWPDVTYDQTAGNITYTLLAASVTEQ